MGFISTQEADAFRHWKYSAGPYTPIDKALDYYYWSVCARIVPDWIAPNAITMTAFLVFLAALVNMLVVSFFRQQEHYESACLLMAAAMWTYMTLDAVDGKQARRLGMSSAMGCVLDHGCDALVMGWNGIAVVLAIDMSGALATDGAMFVGFSAGMAAFWLPQWEHLYRGSLVHWGVTEAELAAVAVTLSSGLLGWRCMRVPLQRFLPLSTSHADGGLYAQVVDGGVYRMLGPDCAVVDVVTPATAVGASALAAATIVRVLRQSTLGLAPLVTLIPFCVHIAASVVAWHSGILARNGLAVYLVLGCQFSKAALRLVVRNAVSMRTSPLHELTPWLTLAGFVAIGYGRGSNVKVIGMNDDDARAHGETRILLAYLLIILLPKLMWDSAHTARQLKRVLQVPYITVPVGKRQRHSD